MPSDLEDWERRRELAFERLGTRDPRCPCGETDWRALTSRHPDIRCSECAAKATSLGAIERHHPLGRHNDPTVMLVRGNDHRILSERQKEWPETTLRNPSDSPLVKAAATIRGFLDWLWMMIERWLGKIPAALEDLDDRLTDRIGASWWETIGWNPGL